MKISVLKRCLGKISTCFIPLTFITLVVTKKIKNILLDN